MAVCVCECDSFTHTHTHSETSRCPLQMWNLLGCVCRVNHRTQQRSMSNTKRWFRGNTQTVAESCNDTTASPLLLSQLSAAMVYFCFPGGDLLPDVSVLFTLFKVLEATVCIFFFFSSDLWFIWSSILQGVDSLSSQSHTNWSMLWVYSSVNSIQ